MTEPRSGESAEPPFVLALDTLGQDLRIEQQVLAPMGIGVQLASADTATLARQLEGARGLLTEYARVDEALLRRARSCQVVVTYTVGVDHVDLDAARARNIVVCHLPDYCTEEVADHAMTLILALSRQVVRADSRVRHGGWGLEDLAPIHRLRGQTLGLVGFGRIARAVAERSHAFGLHVRAFDPGIPVDRRPSGAAFVDTLGALLGRSDIVSLHAPLSASTAGLIDAGAFAAMRHGAYLVNTSRGGLIDIAALLDALDRGVLRGAALDVFPDEPPDTAALDRPELILTPHIGYYSIESVEQAKVAAATAVGHVLSGRRPQNRIA